MCIDILEVKLTKIGNWTKGGEGLGKMSKHPVKTDTQENGCVCSCVYCHVRVYVCALMCVYVCMKGSVYVYLYSCMYQSLCVCVCVCVCVPHFLSIPPLSDYTGVGVG